VNNEKKVPILLKILGGLYLTANLVIWTVIVIMAIHTASKFPGFSPGWLYLIFPTLGIFSGLWIWQGKYNWWRNIIIGVSIIISGLILFIALVAVPKLEQKHDPDAELESKLVKIDKDVERMFLGVYSGDVNIVKEQLEKNVPADARDRTGATALHVTQNVDIARLLIRSGADVNSRDEYNMTPIFNKEVTLQKILVEAGADIHARSEKGNTPLMWYCYSGYLEGIKYMVSQGADINDENSDGQTAYDIAERFHPQELLPYLKSINAKPSNLKIKNKAGL
jgi:hypothetical protein